MDKDLKYYKNLSEKLEHVHSQLLSNFVNLQEISHKKYNEQDKRDPKVAEFNNAVAVSNSEWNDSPENPRDAAYQNTYDIFDLEDRMNSDAATAAYYAWDVERNKRDSARSTSQYDVSQANADNRFATSNINTGREFYPELYDSPQAAAQTPPAANTPQPAPAPNDDERNKFSQARSNYYRKMNQKAKDDAEERLAVIKTLDTSKMSAHGRAEVARNKLRAERALKRDKFTDEDISRMSASDTRERFLSPEEKKARAERNKAVVDQLVKDAERLKAGGQQQQRGKEIADIQNQPGFVSGVAADMNKAVEAEMARRQAKSVSGYKQRALDKEEQEANEEEYENNVQRNRNKKAAADLYDMGPLSPKDEAENQVRAEYGMDPITPEDRERRVTNSYEYEKQQEFNRRHGLPQKTYQEFLNDKKRMSQSEPVRPGITPGVAGPPSQNDATQRIIIGPNGTPITLPRGVGVDENQPPLETVDTPLESPPSGGDVTDKAKTMSVEPGTTRTVPNTQQPNPRPTAAVQPSAATQTPPPSAVGGDVTQRAATMNATAQTQQPASGSVSPTAPTMQAPRQPLGTQITPTTRQQAAPQPYSTQPMNQPMELPPQEDDEQQSGGPTEVNRAIPTPSQNPMAAAVQQKPRGGAVTRAARTFRANARVA